MYRQSHRDYLALLIWLSASSLSWAVSIYRDNAITKPSATKMPGELANAAIADMQMRQRDVAALDAKYTRKS